MCFPIQKNFAGPMCCLSVEPSITEPHADIQLGKTRVATVFLVTLDLYDVTERLPKDLIERIREEQEGLVNMWIELNESE